MVPAAKLWSLGIIFASSCICGLVLPYLVLRFLQRKYSKSSDVLNSILSILNCFSGGVFFSTSILILLPEAREQVEEANIIFSNGNTYPITEFILGIGFLLILIIENVALSCHRKHSRQKRKAYDINLKEQPNTDGQNGLSMVTSISMTSLQINETNDTSVGSSTGAQLEEREMHGQEITNLRNVLMLLALSIHMVFDGLELGLLDKETKIWSVLLALSIHKIFILFSMGIQMYESNSFVRFTIAMLYLSAVSPAGVAIGIALSSHGENLTILRTSAVLQSFAVGTFIYVAFFEILLKEFVSNQGNRILKSTATVLGFGLISVIIYFLHE